MTQAKLILASSSPFRCQLLEKLALPFSCFSPDIDESPLEGESPEALVARLSLEKAQAVAKQGPLTQENNVLVIGSDQVATIDQQILTKPLTHERACQQLRTASDRELRFLTGLCLYNCNNEQYQLSVSTFYVDFLPLSDEQIEAYLRKEQPYQCAGSFKSEGLGITLFKSLRGDDPNSLIGLPLIDLCSMLRKEGIEPLS